MFSVNIVPTVVLIVHRNLAPPPVIQVAIRAEQAAIEAERKKMDEDNELRLQRLEKMVLFLAEKLESPSWSPYSNPWVDFRQLTNELKMEVNLLSRAFK